MEFIITSKLIDESFSNKLNAAANTHSLYINDKRIYGFNKYDHKNMYLCNTCQSVLIINWDDSILSPILKINSKVIFIWSILQGQIKKSFENCYESCNELVMKRVIL